MSDIKFCRGEINFRARSRCREVGINKVTQKYCQRRPCDQSNCDSESLHLYPPLLAKQESFDCFAKEWQSLQVF